MKTTKEMAKIMLAYDRGEDIEKSRYLNPRIWFECKPEWDWHHFDYRIKPKTKYVPFETAEEFLEAQRNNGYLVSNKGKFLEAYINGRDTVIISNPYSREFELISLNDLFRNYGFKDGTPCGKEVKV